MTSLEYKSRQIEETLQLYPNASIRVKFYGSDNYCYFASTSVTNDTWSDTCDGDVVLRNLATQKIHPCDTGATRYFYNDL